MSRPKGSLNKSKLKSKPDDKPGDIQLPLPGVEPSTLIPIPHRGRATPCGGISTLSTKQDSHYLPKCVDTLTISWDKNNLRFCCTNAKKCDISGTGKSEMSALGDFLIKRFVLMKGE